MADPRIEVELSLDTGQVVRGFATIDSAAQKSAQRTGSFFSGIFTRLKGQLLGIAAAVTAAFSVRKAISNLIGLETALAEVNTIAGDLGKTNEELANQFRAVALQFGSDAASQAKVLYQIISAGITDAAQANETLIASNKLAIGGLTDTASAVNLLTTAVNSYGSEAVSATRASDIIFGTVKLGKTTVSELAGSLGQLLPSASAIGVTFEDAAAGVAELTTKGVSTAEAVTQLNAVFTAVLKKQSEAKKFGPAVANAFSLTALKTKGLTDFLKDLNTALGGSEEKLVKLLGRAEGARAILSFAGSGFEGLASKVTELQNSSGAADKAFKELNKTLGQELKKASAGVDIILDAISKAFKGDLVEGIRTFNDNIIQIGGAISNFFVGPLEIAAGVVKIVFAGLATTVSGFLFLLASGAAKIISIFNADSETARSLRDFAAVAKTSLDGAITTVNDGINRITETPFAEKINQNLLAAQDAINTFAAGPSGDGSGPTKPIEDSLEGSVDRINVKLSEIKQGFWDAGKSIKVTGAEIGATLQRTFVTGATNAFASFGRAVTQGKNGFEALGKSVLSTLGGLALQLGQFFILVGTGLSATTAILGVSGGAAIAAGIALSVLGGALQALGSQGTSTGGAGAATPANIADDGTLIDETSELQKAGAQITVNVEGSVLTASDEALGRSLVEIIQDAFDTSGAEVVRV